MSSSHVINTRLASFVPEDYFGQQPSSTASLPDPRPMAENLARSVMEILAGCRELDQISRWVSDDVYRTLLKRVHISARARAARKQSVVRPSFGMGSTIITMIAISAMAKSTVGWNKRAASGVMGERLG